MKKINETNDFTQFEGNGKFANIVRNQNNGRHFKVIVKDLDGTIKTIATKCDYSTAYSLVKEFIEG